MTRQNTAPAWQRRLALAVAVHDTIVAGDRLFGRVSPDYERARLAVVAVIDDAEAAGASEATINAAIAAARADAREPAR